MAADIGDVFRSLRERGPVVFIPLAWLFVTAAHVGLVGNHTLFVAHVVMSLLLAGFAATAYADMREGVLRVWWYVIAVGFVAAALGAAGFQIEAGKAALHAVALYGWMLLPAVGLLYTGRRVTETPMVYLGGGTLCVFGAVSYAAASFTPTPRVVTVLALVAVGVGQTAGILDAAYRY